MPLAHTGRSLSSFLGLPDRLGPSRKVLPKQGEEAPNHYFLADLLGLCTTKDGLNRSELPPPVACLYRQAEKENKRPPQRQVVFPPSYDRQIAKCGIYNLYYSVTLSLLFFAPPILLLPQEEALSAPPPLQNKHPLAMCFLPPPTELVLGHPRQCYFVQGRASFLSRRHRDTVLYYLQRGTRGFPSRGYPRVLWECFLQSDPGSDLPQGRMSDYPHPHPRLTNICYLAPGWSMTDEQGL